MVAFFFPLLYSLVHGWRLPHHTPGAEKKSLEISVVQTTAIAERKMINFSTPFILWYVKVSLSCLASVAVGASLVHSFRAMYKKTDPWKLIALCLLCPITVFFSLNVAVEYSFCDRVVADAFSFGVVMGILYQLNYSLPMGEATVKLVGHRLDGQSEAIWLDSGLTLTL